MFEDLLIPLIIIGLAEFGDKTQLSLVLLASKINKHFQLLLGAVLAFLLVDGIAILIGNWVVNIVPVHIVKIISGVIFIIFGVILFFSKNEEIKSINSVKKPFVISFVLIFLTEWGDKTQIASGLFATRYDGFLVLIGVMIALTLLSILGIYLGKIISDKIDRKIITKVASILFIVIGISFFIF